MSTILEMSVNLPGQIRDFVGVCIQFVHCLHGFVMYSYIFLLNLSLRVGFYTYLVHYNPETKKWLCIILKVIQKMMYHNIVLIMLFCIRYVVLLTCRLFLFFNFTNRQIE